MRSGDPGPRRSDWLRRPSVDRLAPERPRYEEILTRHDRAVASGMSTYTDPASGYAVMTAAYLAERNVCCDSGCRHCPWADADQNPETS